MNIMAKAHKMTREAFEIATAGGCGHLLTITYKVLFRTMLKSLHAEYKEECKTSPVEWYSVEGHVIDEENGKEIPVMEGSSKVETAADCVLYYAKNFKKHSLRVVAYLENGSVRIEKPNTNYK